MGTVNKKNIDNKIIKISKILFKEKNIDMNSNSSNVLEWDSLNHLRLMISFQKNFQIKFKLEEITDINSLKKWSKLIKKKLKIR